MSALFDSARFVMSVSELMGLPETELPEIAFAGRSNAGKSTTINVLCRQSRLAFSSKTPGRTQLLNFFELSLKGEIPRQRIPECFLVDLPGYGYAKVSQTEKEKWGKLIENYLHKSSVLKAVFLLIDIRHEPSANDKLMYDWIVSNGFDPVIIATKLDKIKRSQTQKQLKLVRTGLGVKPGTLIIPFSAETKQGRDEIWAYIEGLMKTPS